MQYQRSGPKVFEVYQQVDSRVWHSENEMKTITGHKPFESKALDNYDKTKNG